MEVREFAEQVLFSDRLEVKRASPDRLTDDAPGPALLVAPKAPGRPLALRFRGAAPRTAFPHRLDQLEDADARGIALHFFANHELLAMELMALALLRFPDAPARFRRAVAATLREEQDHLRRYEDRMHQLGVGFGEVTVSDFFWKSLASMASPEVFAAGMSLTFEQANLDFAQLYRDRFLQVGDRTTARIMDKVLRDEIRHVRHGARWLAKSSTSPGDLFARHRALLPHPLTVRRARGPVFYPDLRRRAGLDADYVHRLEIAGASRGRRPRGFLFNPGVEDELRTGTTPRAAHRVREDLAPLMALLAAPDDVVIVPRIPSVAQRQRWKHLGIEVPDFVGVGDPADVQSTVAWADAGRTFEAAQRTTREPRPALNRRLFSKTLGLELFRTFPEADRWPGWRSSVGERVPSLDALRARVATAGSQRLRAKRTLGASGRGQKTIDPTGDPSEHETWVRDIFKRGEELIVEPELAIVAELTALLRTDQRRPLLGVLEQWNDSRGQLVGHVLAPPWSRLPKPLLRAVDLPSAFRELAGYVAERLAVDRHHGRAALDVRIFRDGHGFGINPLGEVNARCTMGHFAHALSHRVERVGLFLLVPPRHLKPSFSAPVHGPDGRLRAGWLPLTDPDTARHRAAILAAGPSVAAAHRALPEAVQAWLSDLPPVAGRLRVD